MRSASAGQGRIAVAELFTAQGCAYAKAAEDLFDEMTSVPRQNLIILSCHVTMFDTATYKDPFSSALCDRRHAEYARHAGSMEETGVPQVVVNGRFFERAANTNTVHSSIEMAHSLNEITPLQVSTREGFIDITLPKISTLRDLDVWLMGYKKRHYEDVSGGGLFEEKQQLLFVNPVVEMKKLVSWDGRYVTFAVPIEGAMEEADGFAVLAQNSKEMKIVAAGKTEK